MIYDSDNFQVLHSYSEQQVSKLKFLNQFLLIIKVETGFGVFDLRSLKEVKSFFLDLIDFDCLDGYIAFLLNEENPVVVLTNFSETKCWTLPHRTSGLKVHLFKEERIEICVIDEENFIWRIDEFELNPTEFEIESRSVPIKASTVKKVEKLKFVNSKKEKIKSLLDIPSHQIPNLEKLFESIYDILLDKPPPQNVEQKFVEDLAIEETLLDTDFTPETFTEDVYEGFRKYL